MNKKNIIAILVVVLGVCISSINAHTPWGACATIYTDKDKKGTSHDICHSGFLSAAFNKKVSSISVPKGFNTRVFKTSNYKGPFLDIQAGTWNAPATWDKQISSMQFNNWGDGCAIIYTGPDRTGTPFTVCNSADLVDGNPNYPSLQSVYVNPLHFFRFYKNADFTGDWMDIRGNYTFKADWANQAKSMKIQHWSECAWFHNELNRGGRLFQVCDSGTFPAAWANQASSITVPKKMTVTVFKQADFKGESQAFKEGIWNLSGGWDNAIVSVKIDIEGKMTGTS